MYDYQITRLMRETDAAISEMEKNRYIARRKLLELSSKIAIRNDISPRTLSRVREFIDDCAKKAH